MGSSLTISMSILATGYLSDGKNGEYETNKMQNLNIPAMLGWVPAMLDWPSIEPADFLCPTLWLVGSEDQLAIESVREHATALKGSLVQVQIIEGLNHEQVFDQVDAIFPAFLTFWKS